MMEKSNVKPGLAHKGGAIASAVATLTAAAVLAMVPISQAQALGFFSAGGPSCKDLSKTKQVCTYPYRVEGGGHRSLDAAMKDARKRMKNDAKCPAGQKGRFEGWGKMGKWLPNDPNNDWYFADINYECVETKSK